MRVALPDWSALALFAGMVLAVTLYGLTVSTHFPAEHRRAALKGPAGSLILWGTMAVTIAAGLLAVRYALGALPGYAAVLAGGAAMLVAPLILKPLPDTLVDGRAGLLLFAAGALALAAAAV